jgi:conserved hypothetical protein
MYTDKIKSKLITNAPLGDELPELCAFRFLSSPAAAETDIEAFNRDETAAFFRGIFLSCGNLSDPKKEFYLEFRFKTIEKAIFITNALKKQGFSLGISNTKVKTKNSTTIEEFLAFIGAGGAAMEIMNQKIENELLMKANRARNCDTGNIQKTGKAADGMIAAIKLLRENDMFKTLPKKLQETCKLREKYSLDTVEELARRFNPPLSKSGVKHRLEKILEEVAKIY